MLVAAAQPTQPVPQSTPHGPCAVAQQRVPTPEALLGQNSGTQSQRGIGSQEQLSVGVQSKPPAPPLAPLGAPAAASVPNPPVASPPVAPAPVPAVAPPAVPPVAPTPTSAPAAPSMCDPVPAYAPASGPASDSTPPILPLEQPTSSSPAQRRLLFISQWPRWLRAASGGRPALLARSNDHDGSRPARTCHPSSTVPAFFAAIPGTGPARDDGGAELELGHGKPPSNATRDGAPGRMNGGA